MGFPLLDRTERDRRWHAVRQTMAERGIDCLIVWGDSGNWGGNMANVRYLSGVGDQSHLVFPLQGEPVLLVWWPMPFEVRRQSETSHLTHEIFSVQGKRQRTRNPWSLADPWVTEIRGGWPHWSGAFAEAVADLGYTRGTVGLVGARQGIEPEGHFPARTYLELKRLLPEARLADDATEILESARLQKSPAEIACIEKAAKIADCGVEAMLATARPGTDETAVYAAILHAMLVAGSERTEMLFWDSGPTPTHVHGFAPTSRPLQKGDLLINEITPRYAGYVAHPHQSISIGEPIAPYRQMAAVLREARDLGLSKLKPGVTVREAEEAVTGKIEAAGYSYMHPVFHGMGLSLLEAPMGNCWDRQNPVVASPDDMVLAPGMVIAYEPMISTPDRKIGFPLGDTVVITETGCRRLSRYSADLMVLPV